MKYSCVGCGLELEINVGIECKAGELKGFDVFVKCKKCKFMNRISRLFTGTTNPEDVQKLISKIKGTTGSYIG